MNEELVYSSTQTLTKAQYEELRDREPVHVVQPERTKAGES